MALTFADRMSGAHSQICSAGLEKRVNSVRNVCLLTVAVALLSGHGPAIAELGAFAGKTLTLLVGTQVGGTSDVTARSFLPYLRKHLPGNPTIIVQNMTGAGSNLVFNYLAERAAPDGLTIVYSVYQGLAQATGDKSLRARFENFEYLGGLSDTRVNYMRADTVPGGAKRPSDIMKAGTIVVGAYDLADTGGMLSRLSLDVLGVKHKLVVGYRGGSDIFLAMQRNEIQFHNTSIGTFRTRSAAFIKSGEGMPVYYLRLWARTERSGTTISLPKCRRSRSLSRGSRQATVRSGVGRAQLAHGPDRRVGRWAFAPSRIPANVVSTLRTAFARAAEDPDYVKASIAMNGIPPSFVDVERGQAIVRSTADVSPEVLGTLRASMAER